MFVKGQKLKSLQIIQKSILDNKNLRVIFHLLGGGVKQYMEISTSLKWFTAAILLVNTSERLSRDLQEIFKRLARD